MSGYRCAALAAALCCLSALEASGQASGLAFLRISPQAAAAGAGDAYVASTRDAFSTYWNPAGLAAAEGNQASVSHVRWIADVRAYAAAARLAAGRRGAFGLFVTGSGAGDLEAREGPGAADGLFHAQFLTAGLSYARRAGPLRLGATAKYLSEQIYTEDAAGYGFDLGAQLEALRGGLQLGAAVQHLGRMTDLGALATPLPRTARAGAAVYPLRIRTAADDAPLLDTFVSAEAAYLFPASDDGDLPDELRLHVGAGAEVLDMVMVRAGFVTNDEVRRFTFGAGVGIGAFAVDYAFLPLREGYGNAGHFLSLSYGW